MSRTWTCRGCKTANEYQRKKCKECQAARAGERAVEEDFRTCSRCGESKPIDSYYWVSKKLGTRRGQCKECMAEIKAAQKDPSWLPSCSRCGATVDRTGRPGRRLCQPCWDSAYDAAAKRPNGSHMLPLKPCTACGARKLREKHEPNSSLCHVCRSVPQSRRRRLKAFFNMTPREYVDLLEYQAHQCAICSRKFNSTRVPHVDHDHSGFRAIRGATCGPCNSLLGMARDNPEVLRSAAGYLEDPPAQRVYPGRGATEEGNRRVYTPLRRVA